MALPAVGCASCDDPPATLSNRPDEGSRCRLYEAHHAFRIIPTDGRRHPDDLEPRTRRLDRTLGRRLARRRCRRIQREAWLAGTGTIHSDQLHVVERYTRDTPESIVYDVTLEGSRRVHEAVAAAGDPAPASRRAHSRGCECIENNQDLQRIEKLLQNESIFRVPK